jgi:hypothetical protein
MHFDYLAGFSILEALLEKKSRQLLLTISNTVIPPKQKLALHA